MPETGADGHPIPEIQGVVEAKIQPIHAKDLRVPAGISGGQARGVALRLPQFATPPKLVPGTEAVREDGTKVDGTGAPDPSSIEVTPETLACAVEAARRFITIFSKLPLTESSVDMMNLAVAVLHHDNKGNK